MSTRSAQELLAVLQNTVCYSAGVCRARWQRLSPEGQPASEPFQEPPYVCDVEFDVVSEVSANVGVSVHQGAVQGGPTDANHHGNHTQQEQDQAGVSTHLICKREEDECDIHSFNLFSSSRASPSFSEDVEKRTQIKSCVTE